MPSTDPEIDNLCHQIIGCAYSVHNTLGFGFLESVYENSLALKLSLLKLKAKTQTAVKVYYKETEVGLFTPDILIPEKLIIELKSCTELHTRHEVQLVNYLKATKIEHGLLINFGPKKVEVKHKYQNYNSKST